MEYRVYRVRTVIESAIVEADSIQLAKVAAEGTPSKYNWRYESDAIDIIDVSQELDNKFGG